MTYRPTPVAGSLRWLVAFVALVLVQCSAPATTLDGLWNGTAHFEQVGTLDWEPVPPARSAEQASWFAVHDGIWYAFNRVTLPDAVSGCPQDHAGVVVRQSKDHGRTWSDPVSAITPGTSAAGDGCAVLDGSSYFDVPTGTWHILAQCLDRQNAGGWSLCHYSRKAASPRGRFAADPLNPVVRGGALWSRICAGGSKACPPGTIDEGTPDIVGRQDRRFIITIHGFYPGARTSFRGVVATDDFHRWQVAGDGLPGDATLGPADCRAWLRDCTGVGEGTALTMSGRLYVVVERMNKGLLCTTDQDWRFEILRTDRTQWPRSGSGGWHKLPGPALLAPSDQNAATLCGVSYTRWIVDRTGVYLVYEDRDPDHIRVRRRLLKLVAGGGKPVRIQ